jgi:hypothetical protein
MAARMGLLQKQTAALEAKLGGEGLPVKNTHFTTTLLASLSVIWPETRRAKVIRYYPFQ